MFPNKHNAGDSDSRFKLKKSIILKAKEKLSKSNLNDVNSVKGRAIVGRQLLAVASNYTCLETLLKQGIDVNAKDELSRTALHFAASAGDISIMQLLLRHKANPNVKDIIGNTPLHLAACKGLSSVVNLLISNGADIKAIDGFGRNPLEVVESKLRTLSYMNMLPKSVEENMLHVGCAVFV